MQTQILQELDLFLGSPEQIDDIFRTARQFGVFTPDHLIYWFQRFRAGIEYISRHYGVVAEHFLVAEEITLRGKVLAEEDVACYIPDPDKDAIAITFAALAHACVGIANRTLSTSPHLQGVWVSSLDFPFLHGVEEAYHSHYLKSGQGIVDPVPGRYRDDPAELAAGDVVRQAAKEFHLYTLPMADQT